jgi:Niemann-Pick C1 protein
MSHEEFPFIFFFFKTETYVDEIDIYITEKYISGAFDSCKQVVVPSTGQLAFDLMCGSWGATKCSPIRWFSFMGNARDSAFVPFQINYLPQNSSKIVDDMMPLDPKVVPCNESFDVSHLIKVMNE